MMREQIIRSALEQIKKYGFRRFTIEDITADLGISKKTVYKHFSGKDEIISAACSSHMEMEKEWLLKLLAAEGTWLDKMMPLASQGQKNDEAAVRLALELKKYYPEEWEKHEFMNKFMLGHMREFLKQGVASGDIRPDIDVDVLWTIISASVEALFNAEPGDLSLNQALTEFKKVILYGILSPISKMRGAE